LRLLEVLLDRVLTASLYLADSMANSAEAMRWAANLASEFGKIAPPEPRVTGRRGSWGGLLGKYECDLELLEVLEG
jgi:hypothetical protein